MYKVIAKQDYTDKRPELIEEYNGCKVNYNNEGNANIKAKDIYLINDGQRAKEIKESGLAEVVEIEQDETKKEEETESKKRTTRRTKKKED